MSERPSVPCPKCGQPMAEGRACPGFRPVLMCTPRIVRKPRELERHVEIRMEICAHYGRDHTKPSASGVGGKIICAAGIPEEQIPHRPLPCLTVAPCPKKRQPTRDEVLSKMREQDSAYKGCGHMLVDGAATDYARSVQGGTSHD